MFIESDSVKIKGTKRKGEDKENSVEGLGVQESDALLKTKERKGAKRKGEDKEVYVFA